ncbi:unannotated protein [freshwater metagenome]|jgi:hypothetical protein|uniref:Unannotated protein n=1 Tax=freshwater metagenome TaxID=449393 RepID=A0A6J7M4D7_9ZZZZ
MARAMSASGDAKPKAMRVMSRILVFMDSMRPHASPCSMKARMASRWPAMDRCSVTKAPMRLGRAPAALLLD